MDPGRALRNDGLNPPRPPTLGGRLRESGIQAAETVIAGAAAGAAAATRSVSENQTMNVLRGGGDWLDRTLRRTGPPPDEVPAPQIIGRPSEVEPLLERAGQRAAEVERQAARDIEQFASQQLAEAEASEGFATAAEAAAGAAEVATAAEAGGGVLAALGEGALAAAGTVGAAAGGLAVAGAGAAIVGTAWTIEGGLNAAAHMWGATSDASRPSHATDVQTLNGMQESGAIDHFYAQEQRRCQQPQVFRIDTTESEESQPQQQIRARPVRRPRAQPTPFGINQVPIPVSSGSERVSRQSRSDRGPLGTEGSARGFAQPSFDALRQASEPEAA